MSAPHRVPTAATDRAPNGSAEPAAAGPRSPPAATVPGHDLARALAAWLAPVPVGGWRDLPESVTATTGTSPDGRRVHVVHNWSWQPAEVRTPEALTEVPDGSVVDAGAPLRLGAWDVRVLTSC